MTARGRPSADPEEAERRFDGCELGVLAFRRVQAILASGGPCELRVARTQVGWARRRGFAFLWQPGRWLRNPDADVVLTIALPRRDASPRWKEVAEPRRGLFVHHLELHDIDEIDAQVAAWLLESRVAAA